MQETPEWYRDWREALDIDLVEYGGFGIQLLRPAEMPAGQVGFALTREGRSLSGGDPGDWRPEWVVIGNETACGDPIFISDRPPHTVYTAMHGEGSWDEKLVAPSLEIFAQCLRAFQQFAADRGAEADVHQNPPRPEEQAEFLKVILTLTSGSQSALSFWAVQIDVDLDAFNWPL